MTGYRKTIIMGRKGGKKRKCDKNRRDGREKKAEKAKTDMGKHGKYFALMVKLRIESDC